MTLTFFDLETSGLDTAKSDIHQLAYACYDTKSRKVFKANSFYLWEDDYEWSPAAAKVNGISKEFLEALPKEEMQKKYQEIFAVFNRADVIGYNNNNYDNPLLQNFMSRRARSIVFDSTQDVRNMARNYFKGNAGKLCDLPNRLGLPDSVVSLYQKNIFGVQSQAHDATYDVAATLVCYLNLCERARLGV